MTIMFQSRDRDRERENHFNTSLTTVICLGELLQLSLLICWMSLKFEFGIRMTMMICRGGGGPGIYNSVCLLVNVFHMLKALFYASGNNIEFLSLFVVRWWWSWLMMILMMTSMTEWIEIEWTRDGPRARLIDPFPVEIFTTNRYK